MVEIYGNLVYVPTEKKNKLSTCPSAIATPQLTWPMHNQLLSGPKYTPCSEGPPPGKQSGRLPELQTAMQILVYL